MESSIAAAIQFRSSWQGGYRRIRYNVMLESLHTGHIFSIMFDRCIDLSAVRGDLFQVEVEYIRSRTLRRLPHEADGLAEQWEDLVSWTRAFLVQAGAKSIENQMQS
ncbi:hypothetical protein [Acrocarpospora sp. B8E8]|uniref:hypothetical protein n=1 Tax=Acrocarpospora sp. B8E8 TaxID=3153572 RepID=UPI00325DD2E4